MFHITFTLLSSRSIDDSSHNAVEEYKGSDDCRHHESGKDDQSFPECVEAAAPALLPGAGGQVVDQHQQEEDHEGQHQAEDQPHVDQLDVGGGGDPVGDGLKTGLRGCGG